MARWCASANGQGALTKGYNPAYAGCGPLNVHRLGTEARQGQQRGWLCSSLRPHGAVPDRSAKRPQSPVASTRDTGAIHPWEPPTVGVGECAVVWRTRARAGRKRGNRCPGGWERDLWPLATEKGRAGRGGRMGAKLAATCPGSRRHPRLFWGRIATGARTPSTVRLKTFRSFYRRAVGLWSVRHGVKYAEKSPSCGTSHRRG